MSSCTPIPFDLVSQFSARDQLYQLEPEKFKNFLSGLPTLESFTAQIEKKRAKPIDRILLHQVLKKQYADYEMSNILEDNIESLLEENTFTVVTAHQLSLLTGPLYYISKMISCIRLAQEIEKNHPDVKIVPVFVHGGEDHDFEEINHVEVFGNQLVWDNHQGGAIGRYHVDGLREIVDQLLEMLSREAHFESLKTTLLDSLIKATSYAGFMHQVVHHLTQRYGLVQLVMDDPELKRAFVPHFRKEILERKSQSLVKYQQLRIEQALDIKSQAFPRDINLFYLTSGARRRIDFQDERYVVLDSDISFSVEEILKELEDNPESFSPNVVIRPLYQESILPNLAYVGGGGELAYWMERKTQFEEFDICFPLLIRRDSVMVLDVGHQKTIAKLNLSTEDIFKTEDELIKQHVQAENKHEFALDNYQSEFNSLFERLKLDAAKADPSLSKWIAAENSKQEKLLKQIDSRIHRAYKSQSENNIKKIKKLKDQLFPNHGLQERKTNSLPFIARYGEYYTETLMKYLNPLDKSMKVISL